ncbi:DoxX [Bordetella ansorpii]|uniref:DoxX n=1 Tax=Bordetella ansorpii TaxID=288768 RepID=A0A157Q6G0_9BORD|nr:DoxX family protein [Bordetella ansorpii]SAI41331.1 DoxX [Bordetella ansorpii]
MSNLSTSLSNVARPVLGGRLARFIAYLGLCAAYLQGGLVKLTDFPGAIAEMTHFGLAPAPFFAVVVIVLEIAASVMILVGWYRWIGALALAVFTLMATFVALQFWTMPVGQARFFAGNSFFEHLGLVGGFLLVIWQDLNERRQ